MSETVDNPPLDEAPPRRLVRVDEGRWLGGVAAGLGRYFDVNPLVYRIAFAALALVGGTGLLLYLAAYLVIPGEHDEESIAVEALRRRRDHPWLLVGIGLIAFGALFALSEARFWPGTGNVWLAALLVGGALVWWHVSQREDPPVAAETATVVEPGPEDGEETAAAAKPVPAPPPARPRPPKRPSLLAPVVGILLAAAGALGLLAVLEVYDIDVDVALAVALLVVGAAIAFGAVTQRRVGGLVVLGLLLLPAFALAAITPVDVAAGVGDRSEQPLSVTELESSYELGMGSLRVDLSRLSLPSGTTSVDASVGIGELVVRVPPDVAVELDAHVGVGDLAALGLQDDGLDVDRSFSVPGPTPDAPVLDLEVDVAMGRVEVVRG
ncbi:MAG TPA: PspC domain-containing protein [Gaiellaceae bacterium]|jgi:phage shock protein PspC (stress-responsive transcriptional regulator)